MTQYKVIVMFKKTEQLKRRAVTNEVKGLYGINVLLDRVFSKEPHDVAWIKIRPLDKLRKGEGTP